MLEACVTTVEESDPRHTPAGWRRIEVDAVYVNEDGRVAVLGPPPQEPSAPTGEWYAKGHNCDEMGCSSVSHTVLHGTITRPWNMRGDRDG